MTEPRACADCDLLSTVSFGRTMLARCVKTGVIIEDGSIANSCVWFVGATKD